MKYLVIPYCCCIVLLQASGLPDSSRLFLMTETIVTGSRFQTELHKLPVSVQVIDSLLLHSSNGGSIADILKKEAGVFVRSYGAHGSLQSVSLRGMPSDYTLVLVDGKRFTTYQIGTIDLGIFSLADVERIEIIRGSSSALFGADAVGGVINIVTKKGMREPFVEGTLSAGSFGQRSVGADAGGEAAGIMLSTGVKAESGKNDFEFRYRNSSVDTTLRRTGSDYSISTFSFSASDAGEFTASKLSLRISKADRGQPDPVTSQFQNNLARIVDTDGMLQGTVDWKISERLLMNTAASFRYNHETYVDPNLILNGMPLASYYFNRMANVSANLQYSVNDEHRVFTGMETGYGNIASNEVRTAERRQFGLFFSSQHLFPFPVDLLVYPSIRYDSYDDVGDDVCPKMGLNFGMESVPGIRLRGSYGKSFRVPTFNDLYWNTGGNAKIRPERLLSADAGVIISANGDGTVEAEVNFFSISTKDKIVWSPGESNIWTPVNVSSVSSTGVEVRGRALLLNDALHLVYNHTIMDVVKTSADFVNDRSQGKQLRYTPRETASVLVGISLYRFAFNAVYSYTGFRYLQSDNNPRFVLPSFGTVDCSIAYSFQPTGALVRLKCEINNLLNEEYSFISGYPMPLRNVTFTTHLRIQ